MNWWFFTAEKKEKATPLQRNIVLYMLLWSMISFSLERARAEGKRVVVYLYHVGGRRHFGFRVSSSVGHCCQHFWVGCGPNRRRSCFCDKGRTSPWQMPVGQAGAANISWLASAGRRRCCCVHRYETPRLCCRAVERACFWMCTERRTCHLDKHGRRCM